MKTNPGQRTGTRLLVLFVLLSVIPLVALAAVGWHMLDQERDLETQSRREQLADAATVLATELDRILLTWEGVLLRVSPTPESSRSTAPKRIAILPPDAALLAWNSQGVQTRSGASLAFYPVVSL